MGKLQLWCRSGISAPEKVEALDTPDHIIRKADLDNKCSGMVILGIPLGHASFIKRHAELRIEEEQLLYERAMPIGRYSMCLDIAHAVSNPEVEPHSASGSTFCLSFTLKSMIIVFGIAFVRLWVL